MRMTKYMVLTGALLACQLFAGHAAAQNIDGGTLFADCREGDDPNARDRLFKQGHCFGYILGVADALRPAEVYCLPSGATVGQIVDVAKLYYRGASRGSKEAGASPRRLRSCREIPLQLTMTLGGHRSEDHCLVRLEGELGFDRLS